jgi:hypothetical protein
MLQLDDISDTSGGPRSSERQQSAATAATGGNSLPLRLPRPYFKLPRPYFNEETTCL